MHRPPDGLDVGDRLTQSDIEAAFNTGFGYRISGINPRRDDADNRYLLLFANEDGPYDDAVTRGRFEYIGEGLEGDQSEDSPGNAALIDAVSADFPVYFFYTDSDRPEWEYHGRVDVREYRREQRDGRDVLVFTMEHRTAEPVDDTASALYLVPVSDYWRDNFRRSVEQPLDVTQYEDVPPQLDGLESVRIWATTEADSAKKQAAIDAMTPGDYVLFYHNGEFFAGGRVRRTFDSPALGDLIWGHTESRHIYTITAFTTVVPSIEYVWDVVGYDGRRVVQGFTRVADGRVAGIRDEYGSLNAALFGNDDSDPTEADVSRERAALEQAVTTAPALTEDTQYVEIRRKARSQAFTELIRDLYDNTCAVCGAYRETPDGRPEVEAAHIYPKSENGRDDVRNGIALCKLHHWAFDNGWFALSDAHDLIVADAPSSNGYHEFKQLEGQSIRLPEDEDVRPHPLYLEHHRRLHGLDD